MPSSIPLSESALSASTAPANASRWGLNVLAVDAAMAASASRTASTPWATRLAAHDSALVDVLQARGVRMTPLRRLAKPRVCATVRVLAAAQDGVAR